MLSIQCTSEEVVPVQCGDEVYGFSLELCVQEQFGPGQYQRNANCLNLLVKCFEKSEST